MELKFMELEFHKKTTTIGIKNATIGLHETQLYLSSIKKRHNRYLKHHYRAPYGVIRPKKKTYMLKCHYRVSKRHYRALKRHYRAPYGAIRLKKKIAY